MKILSATYPIDINKAAEWLKHVVRKTPLQYNPHLSQRYACNIYLKREDLQVVRSYKLRGAYNMMSSLSQAQLDRGVVCASAGNHAQGYAYSCRQLNIKGVVFMPVITPKQKVNQTRMFGDGNIEIKLVGDTFDDCALEAKSFTEANGMTFIPPFDDYRIIEGQGTVGKEILEELQGIDYMFIPVGGGGLSAGVGYFFKTFSPTTTIIGVEPEGAPSMKQALRYGLPVTLATIDRFVDGASVNVLVILHLAFVKM
jgi:threonine dehydratase